MIDRATWRFKTWFSTIARGHSGRGRHRLELAEEEARAYVDETTCYLGEAQAFALFDPPKRGTEIFSLMRESSLAPEEGLARHFVTGTERAEDAPTDPGAGASTA